jgi:hypothetical protein
MDGIQIHATSKANKSSNEVTLEAVDPNHK